MSKSEQIKAILEDKGIRYWAGDNISHVLQEGDKEELIEYLDNMFFYFFICKFLFRFFFF